MADDIVVPNGQPLSLRILIGGNYPYKWQLYEYDANDTPQVVPNGSGTSTTPTLVGTTSVGQERKFVWSTAIVSNDSDPIDVDVAGEVLDATGKTLDSTKGSVTVKAPKTSCFVHLWIKGQ